MTPLEAGVGLGFESYLGSEKEARRDLSPPVLLVFVAIDEAYTAQGQREWYEADLPALVAAKRDAERRGLDIVLAIAHYMTISFAGQPAEPDDLIPSGVPFPSEVAHVIADRIPRAEENLPDDGAILQNAAVWNNWIRDERPDRLFAPRSRVVIRLDISGSMQQRDFGDVPQDTIALLEASFGNLETDIIAASDERWLKWAVDAWDSYVADHP